MLDVWKKYNIWISVGVFLLLIVALWIFVLAPMRANIENNADEMQKRLIDGETYAGRVSKIPDMEATRENLAANEGSLRVFLNKNSEVDFIKKIESIAEETGNKVSLQVTDDNVSAKAKTAAGKKTGEEIRKALPKMGSLSMLISLEGNYEQMVNFLHKIENLNYYVNVISLSMEKGAVEAPAKDPFAAEKVKAGAISAPTEVIKSNLDVVVYLEK